MPQQDRDIMDYPQVEYAIDYLAGSTTAGIQEALNALPTHVGGVVVVGPGVWEITTTIQITRDNQHIRGYGPCSVVRAGTGLAMDIFEMLGQVNNISFHDLTLDGNSSDRPNGYGIRGVDNYGVRVHNVHFMDIPQDGFNAIADLATPRVDIVECEFTNCGNFGIVVQGGAHCHITGCHVIGCGRVGIFLQDGSLNQVQNNIVTGSGEGGIVIGLEAMDIVDSNTCWGNTEHGISMGTTAYCLVEDNICYDNGYHNIYIWRCMWTTVSGNFVADAGNGYDGIRVQGDVADDARYNQILGNVCLNIAGDQEYGVNITGGAHAIENVVLDNLCSGNDTANFGDAGTNTKWGEIECEVFHDIQDATANVHTFAGTGGDVVVLPAAFTGAQIDVARTVDVACTAVGAPAGDVVIEGINAKGWAITETVTVVPGGSVTTNNAFAIITRLTFPAGIPVGDTVTITYGSSLGLTKHIFTAAQLYKCHKNTDDYSGVANLTVDLVYQTVDVSTGAGINNNDDFTFWYQANYNKEV